MITRWNIFEKLSFQDDGQKRREREMIGAKNQTVIYSKFGNQRWFFLWQGRSSEFIHNSKRQNIKIWNKNDWIGSLRENPPNPRCNCRRVLQPSQPHSQRRIKPRSYGAGNKEQDQKPSFRSKGTSRTI